MPFVRAQEEPKAKSRCLIKGRITDYKTKDNIQAKVVFQKQPDATLTVVSMSGPNGYKANLFERGRYIAIVSAEGFVSEQIEFDLLNDSLASMEEWIFNFELIAIQLNGIIPFYKILFDLSSSAITAGSEPELLRLKSMLEENPGIVIRLEGYADMAVNSKNSLKLAESRIKSVKKWLTERGISSKRIKMRAIGAGKSATEKTEKDTRRANRRVEIRVLEL
jgi:hypothetical protein